MLCNNLILIFKILHSLIRESMIFKIYLQSMMTLSRKLDKNNLQKQNFLVIKIKDGL